MLCSHGAGFTGMWNKRESPIKANVKWDFLQGPFGKTVYKIVKVTSEMIWRTKDFGNSRNFGHLLREDINTEWHHCKTMSIDMAGGAGLPAFTGIGDQMKPAHTRNGRYETTEISVCPKGLPSYFALVFFFFFLLISSYSFHWKGNADSMLLYIRSILPTIINLMRAQS